MIDIQEMYKYSLVLPLDSLKDLEEILTLTKLRCLNILSNIPQCSVNITIHSMSVQAQVQSQIQVPNPSPNSKIQSRGKGLGLGLTL